MHNKVHTSFHHTIANLSSTPFYVHTFFCSHLESEEASLTTIVVEELAHLLVLAFF
jgi:hypothetical protein